MKRATRIAIGLVVVVVGVLVAGVAILKSLDYNSYRATIAEQASNALGRPVALEGDLDLDVSFTPRLVVQDVKVANAAWGSRPQMVTLDRLAAQVELWPLLSGEARVTRLELDGADILLETDEKGRPNWQFNEAAAQPSAPQPEAAEGGSPVVPVIQEVAITDSRITYRQPDGNVIVVSIDDFTAAADDRNAPITISLDGKVDEASLALKGSVGPLATLMEGTGDYPVTIDGNVFGAEISVDGKVALGGTTPAPDFAIAIKSKDLSEVVRDAALAVPALAGALGPVLPLDLEARLLPSGNGYALEAIKATIGDSDIAGRIAFDPAAAGRPRVTAELTSRRIDLVALQAAMPSDPETLPQPMTAPPRTTTEVELEQPIFPEGPLPFEGLRAVDAKASLKAETVLLPGDIGLSAVAVALQLDKGRLRVAPLAATLAAGGTVDGALTVDASGQKAAVETRLNADSVAVPALLAKLGHADLVEGAPASLAVDLSGRGASLRELAAGLDGELTLRVGEGRIRNKLLDLVGADIAMQIINTLNPLVKQEDYTALSCAVARFHVEDGIATADKGIAIETANVNVVGSGIVDLRAEQIDLAVKPEPREGLGINIGSSLAELVRVRGPLSEPDVAIDKVGAAKTAVSIGAAIATGGMSALGQALLDRQTRDPNPCRTALGQAPAAAPAGAQGDGSTGNQPSGGPAGDAKKALEGVGKALEGLFGGSRK